MANMRWEYKIVYGTENLASLGKQGWELVSVVLAEGAEKLYFKRPLPSIREQITLDQRRDVLGRKEAGDPTRMMSSTRDTAGTDNTNGINNTYGINNAIMATRMSSTRDTDIDIADNRSSAPAEQHSAAKEGDLR